MEDKIDKLLSIVQENNMILKSIDNKLDKVLNSSDKMDNHIDEIMSIYNGYKAPLDYISNKVSFGFLSKNKEIKDK